MTIDEIYQKARQEGVPMFAIRSYRQMGFEVGFEKGLKKGHLEGLKKTLLAMVTKRFHVVPESLAEKLCSCQWAVPLDMLIVRFHTFKNLSAFEQEADEVLGFGLWRIALWSPERCREWIRSLV